MNTKDWSIARVYELLPNPYLNDAVHVVLTNGTEERSILLPKTDFHDFKVFWGAAKSQAGIVLHMKPNAPTQDQIQEDWSLLVRQFFRDSHESN